jgi:hypothetical protein
VNGTVVGTGTANTPRPDLVGAYPAWGPDHGFTVTVPATGGNVCVTAINSGPGTGDTQLGCKALPAGSNPVGTLDSAARSSGSIRVAGWALDRDTTSAVKVRVYVNGVYAGQGTANKSRPDVGAAYPASGNNHGFSFTVPGSGGTVCAYAINYGAGSGNTTLGCRTLPSSTPVGNLEAATRSSAGIRVGGWALDGDTTSAINVHVYVNGAFAGSGSANKSRPDVGALYPGMGNNHGFSFTVPGSGGTVCAYAINTGGGGGNTTLGCRAV